MAGQNIKQLSTRTSPALTDYLYTVAGTTDYNVTLSAIKTLFGIGDVEAWQTESITNGTTSYINTIDGTTYGAIEIDYIIKRASRGYRTGKLTIMVDDSHTNGAIASDYYISRDDGDDLGLNLDEALLSAGTIQIKAVADSSDANPVVFNYKIISKRPITVS